MVGSGIRMRREHMVGSNYVLTTHRPFTPSRAALYSLFDQSVSLAEPGAP